jgi:hypothetical protein
MFETNGNLGKLSLLSSTEFLFCLFFLVFSRSSDSSFFFRGAQIHHSFSLHPSPVVNSQIVHQSCRIYFLLNIHDVNREKKNGPNELSNIPPCQTLQSNKNTLVGYIPYSLLSVNLDSYSTYTVTYIQTVPFSPGAVWCIHCSVYMNRGRRTCRHLQSA